MIERRSGRPALSAVEGPLTFVAWALASLVDRRLRVAAGYFAVAAACSLFGVIHSPLKESPLALPWSLPEPILDFARGQSPYYMAGSYAAVAVLLLVWDLVARPSVRSASADAGTR